MGKTMKKLNRRPATLRRDDQGSTFLIVLSVLTLLVLLAATFTYTSRLDVRAADNFSDAVQSRFAALSGLPAAATVVMNRPGFAVAANQRWADSKLASVPAPSMRSAAASQPAKNSSAKLDWTHALQSTVVIQDEGGKLALNALLLEKDLEKDDEGEVAGVSPKNEETQTDKESIGAMQFDVDDLAGVIERLAENQKLVGLEPQTLAESIVAYLNRPLKKTASPDNTAAANDGPSGSIMLASQQRPITPDPEESANEEDEASEVNPYGMMSADPRFQSDEEEVTPRILLIEELAHLKGMPEEPAEAQRAINILSVALTPYNQSRLALELDGELVDALDPNEASVTEIYDGLKKIYPEADEARLKQWAVNLVDWRDEDSVPTSFPETEDGELILGWERTPYINEIWSDSLTSEAEGDDGEYVEIYNPYSERIDLNGWTLLVDAYDASFQLNGAIEANGFVVVTDDRDNSGDPTPEINSDPGAGSFYDIFGRLGNGTSQRILQQPTLNLPNNSGRVQLRNPDGQVVDTFEYTGLAKNGVRSSAQRSDPRIRTSQVRPCTPLERNVGQELDGRDFAAALDRDRAIKSTAELFRIPAYLPEAEEEGSVDAHPKLADSEVGLDGKILDLFALGGERVIQIADEEKTSSQKDADEETELREIENDAVKTAPLIRVASGRININTAPRPVLLALPGMTEELADRMLEWRAGKVTVNDEERPSPNGKAPFESISDFLTNDAVWNNASDEDRLEIYRYFANLITVNSQVFLVDAQNKVPPETNDVRPSQSRNRVHMLVNAQGRPTVLSWRYDR